MTLDELIAQGWKDLTPEGGYLISPTGRLVRKELATEAWAWDEVYDGYLSDGTSKGIGQAGLQLSSDGFVSIWRGSILDDDGGQSVSIAFTALEEFVEKHRVEGRCGRIAAELGTSGECGVAVCWRCGRLNSVVMGEGWHCSSCRQHNDPGDGVAERKAGGA